MISIPGKLGPKSQSLPTHANPVARQRELVREIYLKGEGVRACKELSSYVAGQVADLVSVSPIQNNIAYIFVGSSGRGEMCFQSDIDYMLLTDGTPKQPALTELRSAVDGNLREKGFGVTSCFGIGEAAFFMGGCDFSLLDRLVLDDTLFVAGNKDLYREFHKSIVGRFGNSPAKNEDTLINLLFIYRRFRGYARFDSPRPDVKKGRGGIRDLQFLIQLAKIKYGSAGPGTLECVRTLYNERVIDRHEFSQLTGAANYICMIRNELHFHHKAEQDALDEDSLAEIGKSFRLRPDEVLAQYRAHARNVYDITRAVKSRLRAEIDRARGELWADQLRRAEDPAAPQEFQIGLARSADRVLRLALAWNSTDELVLRQIMDKEKENKKTGVGHDWNTLFALAHNLHSPAEVQQWLSAFQDNGNPYRKIVAEVQRRPHTV